MQLKSLDSFKIYNLFQYKTETGVVNENHVTGLCKINYEASKTKIKKDILECKYPQQSRNHHHQVINTDLNN